MFKMIVAALGLLAILVLDSLAIQSGLLAVFDFAGVFIVLVWLNLATRSEEGAWAICLVISAIFGISRQQNLAALIISLTVALIIVNLILQYVARTLDYNVTLILTFFIVSLIISVVMGAQLNFIRDLLYLGLNFAIAYSLTLFINSKSQRNRPTRYH